MHYDDLQTKLTEDEYNLVRHDYGRKCCDWDEADGQIEMTQELIDKLGVLDMKDDVGNVYGPMDELPEQFAGGVFVATVGNKRYLVNTEGFSYCRYIANVTVVEGDSRAAKLRRIIELAEELDALQQELFEHEWVMDVHVLMTRVVDEAEELLEDC